MIESGTWHGFSSQNMQFFAKTCSQTSRPHFIILLYFDYGGGQEWDMKEVGMLGELRPDCLTKKPIRLNLQPQKVQQLSM